MPDQIAQIVFLLELTLLFALALHPLLQGTIGLPQLNQILYRSDQALVVPRFGQIIRSAGLDQIDRRIKMGPGCQQNNRQIRVTSTDFLKQGDTFCTGSCVGSKVHVLYHKINRRLLQHSQTLLGRLGADTVYVVKGKQYLKGDCNGMVVVDDEDCGHRCGR